MAKAELHLSVKPRWWFYPLYFYPLQFTDYAARMIGFELDLNLDRVEHWIKRGTILRIGNRVVPWT